MPRFSHLAKAAVLLVALAAPSAAQAAPAYYPSGVQLNVPRSTPTSGDWTVCFAGDYGEQESMAAVRSACTQTYLMLAAGAVGSTNYTLLASAPRAHALTDQGTTNNTFSSHGAEWYFNNDSSWGFAGGGDTVNRNPCDTNTVNPTLRLCWQIGGGNLRPGARAGSIFTASNYDRVVLQSTGEIATGSPNPLVFEAQPQGTVSATKTVTYTYNGTGGVSGALDIVGRNADDFWLTSTTCKETTFSIPARGTTCIAKVRFIPSVVGAETAELRFPGVESVTLQGTGGPLPTGPTGPAGPTGPTGADGATGPTGADGATGPTGADGATGSSGVNGETGPTGLNGIDGVNGKDGRNGVNGKDGKDGAVGPKGKRGPHGTHLGLASVGCKVTARRHHAGARIVCVFSRATSGNLLVQLRDSRGSLGFRTGNGSRPMVFITKRRPRGHLHAFSTRGVRASVMK